MRGNNLFNGFQFQQYFIFNKNICPEALIEIPATKLDGYRDLTLDMEPMLYEGIREQHFIYIFI